MKLNDADIRHYIYKHFATHTVPPTSSDMARYFSITRAQVEDALERLATAHQIALAPGAHSIWMAHPFSGIPTPYMVGASGKKYSAN